MSMMFKATPLFNQPLDNWNTQSLTTIEEIFYEAVSFNQNINSCDTHNLINMDSAFKNTPLFNQPLNNWNTSKVKSMSSVFYGASVFNQPLDNWNTTWSYIWINGSLQYKRVRFLFNCTICCISNRTIQK
jgi:hypothetical protein